MICPAPCELDFYEGGNVSAANTPSSIVQVLVPRVPVMKAVEAAGFVEEGGDVLADDKVAGDLPPSRWTLAILYKRRLPAKDTQHQRLR